MFHWLYLGSRIRQSECVSLLVSLFNILYGQRMCCSKANVSCLLLGFSIYCMDSECVALKRMCLHFSVFETPRKHQKTYHFSPEVDLLHLTSIQWCNWEGEIPSVAAPVPSTRMVASLRVKTSVKDLIFIYMIIIYSEF